MQRITIEPTFDRCVSRAGGVRAKEYFGGPLDFENADYIFPADHIVAELKCLEKDPMVDPAFQEKISALHTRWSNEGRVPPAYGRILINTHNLPQDCAIEFLGLLKSQLENSYIRKANRQIRETKARLGQPEARGLLILANDGNFTLDPSVTFNLLHHSLRNQYKSIDSIIYFSVNLAVDIPEIARDCLFWASLLVEDRPKLEESFLSRLQTEWVTEVENELGEKIPVFTAENFKPEALDRLRFRTTHRKG